MSGPDDCIFCKIVRGEVPASKVFEDETCLAFMDIFPISKGHCLLIPKEHYENLFDVDMKVLAHMSGRLAELTRKVNKVLSPDGVITVVANGVGAGQEVPHLHFHSIPRNKGDSFGFKFPDDYREKMADREELESTAKLIASAKV
ncbi:MAG: HIT family protein [Candidatus Thorarchaeota archaeon]|nr:HIT family protein [Candidatus Thorarchaeota archaeon]